MQWLDRILVALILIGAAVYLYHSFKPKGKKGSGCGCSQSDCKVPKPKLDRQRKEP